MFEEYKLHKSIICIDFKSFYASVECVMRGLDPFTTPLVVADRSRGNGALCLAVSPYLKSLGVPARARIFDIPDHLKKNIIYARPRMKSYMEMTMKIVEIYLSFVSESDLYVYSIDETFLDLTTYLDFYKKSAVELAKEIVAKIYKETGLPVSVGIGDNMLLAKLAMDIESKKNKDSLAKWTYDDVPKKLWPVKPLSKMWGIGHRMEANLNRLGLYSIGDIASYPCEELKRLYGVIGEELWYHTHGIDMSLIQDKDKLRTKNKSYGLSQVLFHDYDGVEIQTIVLEMVDEAVRRLRMNKKKCRVVHFGLGYSSYTGGGFNKQVTLSQHTSSFKEIYQACLDIFHEKYDGSLIRTVHVSLGQLADSASYQLSLFEDYDELEREQKLLSTIDEVKTKFGKNSINRGSSLNKESTIVKRNTYVGGHHE